MQLNRETFTSPPAIFAVYIIAACFCIMVFRLIFPGEIPPLPVFSHNWRLTRGLIDILTLYPALVFSALVVPFGIASDEQAFSGFSAHLFQRLMTPLIIAICAAALYALLFFLALPLAENHEDDMRFQGNVYRLAKERAQAHRDAREWPEVSQFLAICDGIWENSPELSSLRNELEINLEHLRYGRESEYEAESARDINSASVSALPGQGQPLDAAEAIALGETALSEGRLFDAHWLAILGGRIAKPGSPEKIIAGRLAGLAWNQIELQQPSSAEETLYSLYRKKLDGYEAMVSGDWIRAYYIFKELINLTPHDPDVENFLVASEKGTKESAFFLDEMEVSLGGTLTDTVFSLPADQSKGQGRAVMRIGSLSSTPDYAYGIGIEYMVFDSDARPLLSLQAPYAKILPITLNDQPEVLFMMRALDRYDRNKRWEPKLLIQDNTIYRSGTAQITLNVSYETFITLSEMRQELSSLHIRDLFIAAYIAEEQGYIPEVYEAEVLNRLGACLFFLPMAVIAIIIGWRFRARQHPRYFFVLLLPVLPMVFNGLVFLYRSVFNIVGITLLLAVGFSNALTLFIVILAVSFIASLFFLAAQHD